MKYNFKEGDWFDARKLSPWQKQWCLDNLDFLDTSRLNFENERYDLWLYKRWCGLVYGFGSASKPYVDTKNELSFNDFYWGEDIPDEEEEIHSVFTTPKYVTFDKNQDIMDIFLGKLEHDKDYKVVASHPASTGGNKLTLENGVTAHEGYFYPNPTWQDMTYLGTSQDEDSFDNLVYVAPKVTNTFNYYTLITANMSKDQLNFLLDNISLEDDSYGQSYYLNMRPEDGVWSDNNTLSEKQDIIISFNDIFVEKTE